MLYIVVIVLLNLYLACAYKVCHTAQQEHSQNGNNGGEISISFHAFTRYNYS